MTHKQRAFGAWTVLHKSPSPRTWIGCEAVKTNRRQSVEWVHGSVVHLVIWPLFLLLLPSCWPRWLVGGSVSIDIIYACQIYLLMMWCAIPEEQVKTLVLLLRLLLLQRSRLAGWLAGLVDG